jgi:hypothetical protein
MERFENWMSYSYDGVEYGRKTSYQSQFKLLINKKVSKPIPSYKDALFNNAMLMRDMYSDPFDVCLSGGVDSEVVVRTFKTLGIKFKTFIFRLEDDLNIRDVSDAIDICTELNLDYKIIDFNLRSFFENDALSTFNRHPYATIERLPRLKWIDHLDNIPIFGDGEPYWRRQKEDDYSIKSEWKFVFSEESQYANSFYARDMGRKIISEWYEYTPEILLSYYRTPLIQKLLNDEIFGKLSCYSSRAKLHSEIWPEIKYKQKLVGYEGLLKPSNTSLPEFMVEFDNAYLSRYEYSKIYYSIEELENLLLD